MPSNAQLDLNVSDEDGYTPLMTAAHFGHYEILVPLLKHKARARIRLANIVV